MRTRITVIAVACIVIASAMPAVAQGQGFKVVVNDSNPASSVSKDQLSLLFLKRTTKWQNNQPAVPVDLPQVSPVRSAFSTAVHERSVSTIKNYWQSMIFSGRAVPPSVRATDEEILAFVRADPGAVGYVAATTPIGEGVKVLEVTGL